MRPSKSAARSADRRAYRGFPAISSMPGSARCGGALWRTAVTVLFVSLFLLHATEGKERVRRLGDPASAAPAPAGGLSPVDWWSPLWPILLAWGWFVALMSAGTSVRLFGFNQQNARDVVSWCSNHSSREELGMLLTAFWIVLAIMVTVSVPVAGATDFAGKIGAEQAQFCNILALLFSLYAVLLAIAVCYVLKTGGVTAQWRWLWKIISNMVACSATAILFAVLRERDGFTQQPGTNPEKWLNVAETLLSTHGMLAALKWVFEVFCSPELGNRLRENRRIMPDVVTGTPNIAVAILAYCVYTVTVTVLSVISQREAFGVACLMTTSCLFYAVFILIGRVPQPDIGVGWHVVPKNVQRVYLALVLTWFGVSAARVVSFSQEHAEKRDQVRTIMLHNVVGFCLIYQLLCILVSMSMLTEVEAPAHAAAAGQGDSLTQYKFCAGSFEAIVLGCLHHGRQLRARGTQTQAGRR